ncbi:DUF7511 domain-containing protein [Halobacterium yunchengense]|uniref:DUF7511 domain-containing protein n=1 Tax=Halobacterium yunchengense TaxID=3108497 RepID=UPI00300BF829
MATDPPQDAAEHARLDHRPEPLEATVVRYENGPDRCTVSPRDVDRDRQLTAWLSVNAAALVALEETR